MSSLPWWGRGNFNGAQDWFGRRLKNVPVRPASVRRSAKPIVSDFVGRTDKNGSVDV